jgi:glutamate 5-kinase
MKKPRGPVVLKFGTGVLAHPGGSALDRAQFRRIAEEVAGVIDSGCSCVIVSSAAVAAGVAALGYDKRPGDLPGKQACAAVGQPRLMHLYTGAFQHHGITVAQLLLTHGDIDSRTRHANARNTLARLLSVPRVVPIINENDSVAVEELRAGNNRIGDNDRLSAEVAVLVGASRLVLVTSSNGLTDAKGRRIRRVNDLSSAFQHVRPDKGAFSVGGMATKLEAVGIALAAGIPTTIADGRQPGQIALAAAGRDAGTRFIVSC